MPTPTPTPTPTPSKTRISPWALLLVLPYLALCFPSLYNRMTPDLMGFPFFYWYQLTWVIIASAIMLFVYRKLKS